MNITNFCVCFCDGCCLSLCFNVKVVTSLECSLHRIILSRYFDHIAANVRMKRADRDS